MTVGRIPSVEGGIQPTIVDAKGDLIAAVAADSLNRLAVGSNDQVLVADSAASTGLAWKSYGAQVVAGKNAVINGGFDIWQRGTSFSIASTQVYTADRFSATVTGTMTISRQTTGVPAGSQYCLRMASNLTNSVTDFFQYIETANVVPLQGKTVTYSIKMRRNATNTSDSIILIQKSSTTDAGGGASWSNISSATIANSLLPTGTGVADWYTASLTLTIPNDGTANSLRVYASTSAQIPNAAYLELAQLQLELGSTATPFSRAGGTIQGELAACQRYYFRFANSAATANYGLGYAYNTTSAAIQLRTPVTMRITPSTLDYSTIRLTIVGTADYAITGLAIDAGTSGPDVSVVLATGASGLTQYRPYSIGNASSTAGYIGLSAEL